LNAVEPVKDDAVTLVGTIVQVTADSDKHEQECKALGMSWPLKLNGQPRTQQIGQEAVVTTVLDGKAQLSNKIGWVPIRSLGGHENDVISTLSVGSQSIQRTETRRRTMHEHKWPMDISKCVDETSCIEEANTAIQERLPEKIVADQGQLLQKMAQQLVVGTLESYYPEVFISYATGNRKEVEDFPGFGPGTFYTLVMLKLFHQFGIPCFSGLMVPPGTNWETFLVKLGSRFSKCKVLIVIQTRAFYHSFPCLEEVFKAASSKVRSSDGTKKRIQLLPVRFEDDLPQSDDQWPEIEETDTNKILWLQKVQDTFGKVNSIPSPPATIATSPDALLQVVNMVHVMLDKKVEFIGDHSRQSLAGPCPATSSPAAGSTENDTVMDGNVIAARFSDKKGEGHRSIEKLPVPKEKDNNDVAEPGPEDPTPCLIGNRERQPSEVQILVDL
jgi:hypothetical protein